LNENNLSAQGRLSEALNPIMERHPDLVAVGDTLVILPVRHFIRSISLAEIGNGDTRVATWGVQILWTLEDSAQIWNFIQPGYRATPLSPSVVAIEKVMPTKMGHSEEIERAALPFLQGIQTIPDVMAVASDPANPCSDDPHILFQLELAAGRFNRALEIFDQNRNEWLHNKDYYWSRSEVVEDLRLRKIAALLEGGAHSTIGELLRKWERWGARRGGVEHLWSPTPFPFEAGL
jgi:hypothetical protein